MPKYFYPLVENPYHSDDIKVAIKVLKSNSKIFRSLILLISLVLKLTRCLIELNFTIL